MIAAILFDNRWRRKEYLLNSPSVSARGIYAQRPISELCATGGDDERSMAFSKTLHGKTGIRSVLQSTCTPVDHDARRNGGAYKGFWCWEAPGKVDLGDCHGPTVPLRRK